MRTFHEYMDDPEQRQPAPAVQTTQQDAISQWQWLENRWKDLPQDARIQIIRYVRGIVGDNKD